MRCSSVYRSIFINGIVFSCYLSKNEAFYCNSCQNSGLFKMKPLIGKPCRCRVESCRQGNDKVQTYNIRFRQLLNKFCYAVQIQHQKRTERSIALKVEEKTAMKRYVMNLRDEIDIQVRALRPITFSKAQQDLLEAKAWHREKLRNRPTTSSRSPSPTTIRKKSVHQTHRNITPSCNVVNYVNFFLP